MASQARIWVTEKPAAARDLIAGMKLAFGANVTNAGSAMRDGYFTMSNGDMVLPLRGHIVETVRPSAYLSPDAAAIEQARDYARYQSFLPIIPAKLICQPRADDDDAKGKKKGGRGAVVPFLPYRAAKGLLKGGAALRNASIVNAGDTDREGQLIVDEMLEEFGIDPSSPQVKRIELVSNRAEDIAAILKAGNFELNGSDKWRLRAEAARTRQYLDFVWGINFSIAFQAILGRTNTAIGRVQTPVLNMVAERDLAIANFKPRDFFVPVVTLRDGTVMRWHKRADAIGAPGFDEEGRIIDRNVALQIVRAVTGGLRGTVLQATAKDYHEAPPLPFSLGALQAHAAREHGMTLDEVEDAAKGLYKDKFISYVGTDCRFLPESMHADARSVMLQLVGMFPGQAGGAQLRLKSKAFNDAKLDEHFAITPMAVPDRAPPAQMAVFRTIAKRFICQFYPDHVYRKHALVGTWGSDEFRASEREVVVEGWKSVERESETSETHEASNRGGNQLEIDADDVAERNGA